MILLVTFFLLHISPATAMYNLIEHVYYRPQVVQSLKELALAKVEQELFESDVRSIPADLINHLSTRLKRKYAFLLYSIFKQTYEPEMFTLPIPRYNCLVHEGNFIDNCRLFIKTAHNRHTLIWDLELNECALDIPYGRPKLTQDHHYLFHSRMEGDYGKYIYTTTIYDLKTMKAVASSELESHEGDVLVFDPETLSCTAYKNLWFFPISCSAYYPKGSAAYNELIERRVGFAQSMPENSYILIPQCSTAFLKKYLCSFTFCNYIYSDEMLFSNDGTRVVIPKKGYLDLKTEQFFPILKFINGRVLSISPDTMTVLAESNYLNQHDRYCLDLYNTMDLVEYSKHIPYNNADLMEYLKHTYYNKDDLAEYFKHAHAHNNPSGAVDFLKRIPFKPSKDYQKGKPSWPNMKPKKSFVVPGGFLGESRITSLNHDGTLAVFAFDTGARERSGQRHYVLYDLTTGRYTALECSHLTYTLSPEQQLYENGRWLAEDIKFNDQGDLFIGNSDIHEERYNLVFKFDFSKLAPSLSFKNLLTLIILDKRQKAYLESPAGKEDIKGLLASLTDESARIAIEAYFSGKIAEETTET